LQFTEFVAGHVKQSAFYTKLTDPLKKTSTKATMDLEGAHLLTYFSIMPTVTLPVACAYIHHYAPARSVL